MKLGILGRGRLPRHPPRPSRPEYADAVRFLIECGYHADGSADAAEAAETLGLPADFIQAIYASNDLKAMKVSVKGTARFLQICLGP